MSDEKHLLEAILAAPDDDQPRLVYADWLQERGDPRGLLIQLQCQLAAAPTDERRRAMRIEENRLLAEHAAGWTRPLYALLPAATSFSPHEFRFARGFVEHASIPLSGLGRLEALLAAAPLLRSLRVVAEGAPPPIPRPRLDGALAAPCLERLRSLELGLGGAGNELAREVAAAPTLAGLRSLGVHASVTGEAARYFEPGPGSLVLDDEGAALLAASPHLAGLERLDLAGNRLTAASLPVLARGFPRLRALALAENQLPADGLAEAFGELALGSLELLDLSGNTLGPREAAALAGNRALGALRELELERCHLGAKGTAAFCEALARGGALALSALRRLRLERNSLGDAGALAVAGCARLGELRELEAGHNRIGQKGAAALASSPHLAKLERLTLNEPRWKPETDELFRASPTLAQTKIYLKGKLLSRKPKRGELAR